MRWRKHVHLVAVSPVALAGLLFALIAWWQPLAGMVAAPEARMYFSTSTPALSSSCDASRDGTIDTREVSILKLYWKGFPQPEIDCNQDGFITSRDLSILMGGWTGDIPAVDPRALPSVTGPGEATSSFRLAIPSAQIDGRGAIGERFTALLILNAGDRRMGAGEAVVSYDANRLAVRAVHTSPSIWTAWAERPHPPYGSRLVFAGGRPGGFAGSLGLIAEIEFEVVASGANGLGIRPESSVYAADRSGTPVTIPVNPQGNVFMLYDEAPPEPAEAQSLKGSETLHALLAPSPIGPVWMVDLSGLASDSDIPTYEIEDGEMHSIQRDDGYVLGSAALSRHMIRVSVHHADGSIEAMNVRIKGLPGNVFIQEVWARLGFWIILELVFAGCLLALVLRRRFL